MARYLFQPFYEAVCDFIQDLRKNPCGKQELPEVLKKGGYDRQSLIRELIRSGVLSRTNKIDDSDRENVMYRVKYDFHTDGCYKKIEQMYNKAKQRVVNESVLDRIVRETIQEVLNECTAGDAGGGAVFGGGAFGGDGAMGGTSNDGNDGIGGTSTFSTTGKDGGYFVTPIGRDLLRREIYRPKKRKKKEQ